MNIRYILFILITGCSTLTKSPSSETSSSYREDLSEYRPKIEEQIAADTTKKQATKRDAKTYVDPKFTVNNQLDAVLDSIDRINLNRKFIDGFTIQVYSGLKREEALIVKKDLTTLLPNLISDVYYNQPNFRVKAGRYFSVLEAQRDYQQIKTLFPNAIIVPDKITLKQ